MRYLSTLKQMETGIAHKSNLSETHDAFAKKFNIIKEITSAIAAMDNINSVANLVLELAVSYTNADKGSLILVNEKNELSILAANGIDSHFIRTYKAKIGEGIAGTVAQNRIPVLVSDIDSDERFRGTKREKYKTRSFISCPVLSKNRLIGIFNINDKQDNTPFTEEEFELMKVIADLAAISLENALLMNQLKSKASELEEINRKLIEADITKTEFLTRASHELRTPLNSIKGAIYYLQKTDTIDKAEQNEFYDIISNETGTLIGIIENLLDFIRLEDELKSLDKTIIRIQDIIPEILKSRALQNRLAKKNLTVRSETSSDVSEIVGDRIKTGQFFINIIEGLSSYLHDGGTISISMTENDFVHVELAVSDEMPETVFAYLTGGRKIFDTDQPEEVVKLYLARKVAELQGWMLDLKNENSSCIITARISKNIRHKRELAIVKTTEMFVDFITEILDLKTCSIMLGDRFTGELTIKSARGLDDDIIKRTRLRPGDKIAGWVALEGTPLFIQDIEKDPRFGKKNIPQYNATSLISLPLKIHDRVLGVLNLNNKRTTEQFSMHDFHVASVISERISYFVEKFSIGEYNDSDLNKFIKSFELLIDAERKYHKKQTQLSGLMMDVAATLGLPETDLQAAQYAAVIYDLGLMLIDDTILQKDRLSESEEKSIRSHPHNTVFLLEGLEFSDKIKQAILHHHERYDGSGYPDGLKGEGIPLIARILYVIDSYCAMTGERPYRRKLSKDETLEEIKSGSGTLYDPSVVSALESVLAAHKNTP